MEALIFLFLIFCGSVFAIDGIYYITPVDEGGTCDVGGAVLEPCLPLTDYTSDMLTSNESHLINLTLLFLPGEHLLTILHRFSLNDFDTLVMSPYNDANVSIACTDSGEFNMEFSNVRILKICSLSFLSCAKRDDILTLSSPDYFELVNCSFHNNTNSVLFIDISEGATASVNITASNFTQNNFDLSEFAVHPCLIKIITNTPAHEVNFSLSNCIFDNNTMINILWMDRVDNLELTDCTFTNNKIERNILFVRGSTTTSISLIIRRCLFRNNSFVGSRALNIENCQKIELSYCTFFANNGGAAHMVYIREYAFIRHCTFISNTADDFLLMNEAENLELTNCTFITNTVKQVVYVSDCETLIIRDSHFKDNFGFGSTSLYVRSCRNIELNHSTFSNNTGRALEMTGELALINGCIFDGNSDVHNILLMNSVNNLEMIDCNFTNNMVRQDNSRTLSIISCQEVKINNCIFSGNVGGAVRIADIHVSVLIRRTHFLNNRALDGGGIYVLCCQTVVMDNVHFANNKVIVAGGAVYAENSLLTCNRSSTIHIVSNTAGNSGGGIVLADGSKLELSHGSKIYFSNNSVTAHDGKGGAIFLANNCSFEYDTCPMYMRSYADYTGKNLHFDDNNAAEGSILYGGKIYNCSIFESEVNETLSGIMNLITSEQSISHAIIPDVVEPCFCENDTPDCTHKEMSISRYQGQIIVASIVNFNELHEPIASTIMSYYNNPYVSLNRNERTRLVPAKCQEITFHAYSKKPLSSVELIIENLNPCKKSKGWLTIDLDIQPCPPGFELSGDECICDKRLLGLLEVCDIEQQIGKSKINGWFQYDKEYLMINHYCPLDYCTKITSFFHDQCANNRKGVLCGACVENYSIGLGSWRCLQCTHSQYNFIWLVPLIATAGVVLVAFLLLLKLTVSSGTINGLVFYANVISVSQLINLPDCSINPLLSVFISWVNLDFGIETCFYSGMDTYQKTWLQFAFPLYIWFLVGIIIIVCHYSSRAMKLMGKRCIDILATLFLLSYAKLLKTIITALSSVNIMIAKADNVSDPLVPHKVWTYDGNVDYLTGKHLPLFVVALFFLVFLFLPYTLLLTFGQCLRSLPRKRGLKCVQSIAFMSITDAYHAPYNRRHRYWTGLTLLTRCALFTVFAANTYSILTTNMFTTVIVTSLLLVIRLLVANTVFQNYFKDKLDLFFLLNLEFLAGTVYYLNGIDADKNAFCKVTTASVTLAFIVFLGIVLYHVYLQVRETGSYKKVISKLSKYKHIPEPEAAVDSLNDSNTTTTFFQLRESFLENSLN